MIFHLNRHTFLSLLGTLTEQQLGRKKDTNCPPFNPCLHAVFHTLVAIATTDQGLQPQQRHASPSTSMQMHLQTEVIVGFECGGGERELIFTIAVLEQIKYQLKYHQGCCKHSRPVASNFWLVRPGSGCGLWLIN